MICVPLYDQCLFGLRSCHYLNTGQPWMKASGITGSRKVPPKMCAHNRFMACFNELEWRQITKLFHTLPRFALKLTRLLCPIWLMSKSTNSGIGNCSQRIHMETSNLWQSSVIHRRFHCSSGLQRGLSSPWQNYTASFYQWRWNATVVLLRSVGKQSANDRWISQRYGCMT